MVVGMVIAGTALGWIGLALALLLGHPIWLALIVQSGLGAGLVLLWGLALALRSRTRASRWPPALPHAERARLHHR